MSLTRSFKVFLIITFVLTACIYLLGLNGVFVYDDYMQIVNRKQLHNIFNFHDVIFCGLRQNRVLQNISIAINWTLSPGKTWSFKLFSLLLHLINGSLVYIWLKKIFSDKPYLPVLAAAIFLIHPLQIQSVTYAMGVIMLLYGFFNLLILNIYSKYGITKFPLLIFLLIFSLFARETCSLIPIMLLAYEIIINQTAINKIPKRKWAIILSTSFFMILINNLLSDPGKSMYAGVSGFNMYPFWPHLASQLYFQSFYFILFLNPNLQSIFHGNPSFNNLEILATIAGGLIWLLGGLFIFIKYKKMPRTAFLVFLFFINYLQANSFLQMVNPFAEYRLYFSNLLLSILLAEILYKITKWLSIKTKSPINIITVASVFIAYFSIYTIQNVLIWKKWPIIFSQAIKNYPGNEYNYFSQGIEYLHAQMPQEAYENFHQARILSKWFYDDLLVNYFLTAIMFRNNGNYSSAWKIIEQIDKDDQKEKLPQQFYTFKESLEKEMKSLNISTENHWEKEAEILKSIQSRSNIKN